VLTFEEEQTLSAQDTKPACRGTRIHTEPFRHLSG
jgi:hypothetical protein